MAAGYLRELITPGEPDEKCFDKMLQGAPGPAVEQVLLNVRDQPSDLAWAHVEKTFLLPNSVYRIL
jgi:hypothetical protein